MNKEEGRILELRELLHKYNYEYYVLNQSSISDYQFDALMNELIELEKKNPSMYDENSPTNRVGGMVVEDFNKIEHRTPMMSLGDVFSYDELRDFHKRIRDVLGYDDVEYICELKIDGLAMSLMYENGKLVKEGIVQFYLDGVDIGSIDLSKNQGHQSGPGYVCTHSSVSVYVKGKSKKP